MAREEFVRPVGFAREPKLEVRRWIARILLGLVLAGLGWLLVNRVVSPPDDSTPIPVETQGNLPGPL